MKVLVTGASGVVGDPLCGRCEALGLDVGRAGRSCRTGNWIAWDMADTPPRFDRHFECLLHTAPLWLLPGHLGALAGLGIKRIVCYSSTSALTKRTSTNRTERNMAKALNDAEGRIFQESIDHRIATTVFRPTMIYGYGRDKNITTIAGFIRKYGFFPVAGNASGKRQPIHADDLVEATVSILSNERTYGKTYNLAGGETLTYRAMVERIFKLLRRPERIIGIPAGLYKGALDSISLFSSRVTGSMIERMNRDMVFDTGKAREDFAFAPEGFLEHPERDLPAT